MGQNVEIQGEAMKQASRSGFTLVEVLTVIAIIALLAALVLGLAGHAQKTAAKKKAASEIAQLESFITAQQMQHGQVPPTMATLAEALRAANHPLAGLLDPWGNPYQYQTSSLATYFLWSTGGAPGVPASYVGRWP
jgi:general secretion pathway protein G